MNDDWSVTVSGRLAKVARIMFLASLFAVAIASIILIPAGIGAGIFYAVSYLAGHAVGKMWWYMLVTFIVSTPFTMKVERHI